MAFVDQIDLLYDLSHQVIKDFKDITGRVDRLRHKASTVKLLLMLLAKKLTNI